MVTPKTRKTPAAAATAAPFASLETFSVTSALASSISSRTSSEAFSETSATTSPRLLSALSCGLLPSLMAPTFSGSGLSQTHRRRRRPRTAPGDRRRGRWRQRRKAASRRSSARIPRTPPTLRGPCLAPPGWALRPSVGRVLVEHAHPDRGGDPVGDDRGQGADARQQAAPQQAL